MWTPETFVEITEIGLAEIQPEEIRYVPTDAGSAHIRLNDAFKRMCQAPEPTEEEIEEEFREQVRAEESARCPTCGGSGSIPIGSAGNCEFETNCPDCTPDWR